MTRSSTTTAQAFGPCGDPPAAFDDTVPLTVIEARPGWRRIDFLELWRARETLYFLVWRDIKVRYKQTVIGAGWAIVQPVFNMLIFSLVFGRFARIPSDGVPYPIFVYAGLLPWIFFSSAVSQAGMSLIAQAHLLTKIYFPRLFLPAAPLGVGLVDFALSFIVLVGMMFWYGYLPGLSVLLLPLLLLLTITTALGMGYLLASLTVTYRDFRIVIPFMLQAWMYLSPVVYPVSLVPEGLRWLMALNPMTGIIGGFRSVLLNEPLDGAALLTAVFISAGLFVLGVVLFRRAERRFADIA